MPKTRHLQDSHIPPHAGGNWFFNDFYNSVQNFPWVGAAVSAGTVASSTTNANALLQGLARITSSTTANSGYRWSMSNYLIKGREYFACGLVNLSNTTTTYRIGFSDSITSADAVDGVYFEVLNGVVTFKTSSNSVRTTSATIGTLALTTDYVFIIEVNSGGTSVAGSVYNYNGTQLGTTQTITTNIPTGAGRFTDVCIVCTNSGTVATAMVDLDFISFNPGFINRKY